MLQQNGSLVPLNTKLYSYDFEGHANKKAKDQGPLEFINLSFLVDSRQLFLVDFRIKLILFRYLKNS
jgi:hypothetical protein